MPSSDSTNYRKDTRTQEQFEQNIKLGTAKEKFLVKLFQKECEYLGYKCIIVDNGVDNSGAIVKRSNCQPDYKLTINTGVLKFTNLYEIKNSPVSTKWTFKCYDLKQYVNYNANILIFWGTGYIEKEPEKIDKVNTRWGILETNCIIKMLDTYKPYIEYKFGNKECIQIPSKDFSKWLYIHKLHDESQ